VDARRGAGASKYDDVLDFSEREPKSSSLTHERQEAQHIYRITTVPGGGPACRGKDLARLVHAKGLAAHAAARRNLADEKTVFHSASIRLAPWGKVKRQTLAARAGSRGLCAEEEAAVGHHFLAGLETFENLNEVSER
jgi:hypothetical protein